LDSSKLDLSALTDKAAALYLDLLQQIRESSTAQSEHADKMLIWAIGLMGAGVFYANTLLTEAPRGLRFIALAPWILGILVSLAARVIGSRQAESGTTWYLKEVFAFKSELLLSKNVVDTIVAQVGSLVRIFKEFQGAMRSGSHLWCVGLSLAAHVLAGTGVLTVVAVAFFAERRSVAVLVATAVVGGALVVFVFALRATTNRLKTSEAEAAASFAALRKSLTQEPKR